MPTPVRTNINERSWAIELISEINSYSAIRARTIKRASGEMTVNTGRKRLFPDVLLHGDWGDILMWWELKLPDTLVTDREFIDNATSKAVLLWLEAFLLWNASVAVLYLKDSSGTFRPEKTWNELSSQISNREDVPLNQAALKVVLFDILETLNTLFETGRIQRKSFIEAFNNASIVDLVLRNEEGVAERLKEVAINDGVFSAETNIWWSGNHSSYPQQDQWRVLAQLVLIGWVNKFIFAHILKNYVSAAWKIMNLTGASSIEDAISVFEEICNEGDFWNVFKPQAWEKHITSWAWGQILDLHGFMGEMELGWIDQVLIQKLLENVLLASKRKVAWQYATPMHLARILVGITATNGRGIVYDPCCGTGTIVRAAYDIKKEKWIPAGDALGQILASDKFSFPLQLATLSITEPENIWKIIPFFKEDCTELTIGDQIEFRDPNTGSPVLRAYEPVDYMVSNLPFIQQEDLNQLNPGLKDVINTQVRIECIWSQGLSGKSDLYAYLPLYLWRNIKNGWGLGIVVSNSWLGVEWGRDFRKLLSRYYKIESIITSGNWRWFSNAAVVTTLIILRKRDHILPFNDLVPQGEKTRFAAIKADISTLDKVALSKLADHLLVWAQADNLSIRTYETSAILDFNLNWTSLFWNVDWIESVRSVTVPVESLFEIARWERRGWDAMFYPEENHGIEEEFIKPVLKSPREITKLTAEATSEAFCCSATLEELTTNRKSGAMQWIGRFSGWVNENWVPLTQSLARSWLKWYEMRSTTMADLVASINYGDRLFIAKLKERSFVNQRLARFTKKTEIVDVDLCHALLNSALGMFFIEALGFGRWQWALDLSANRMKSLPMLNPNLLTQDQAIEIKNAFLPILNREILPAEDEIRMSDREIFESIVLWAFWISEYSEKIKTSLLMLLKMRKTSDNWDN